MTCCVYAIRNLKSGRLYVGSSKNTERRWSTHRAALRRGRHHAPLLQRSWDRNGEAAFIFEILEACAPTDLIATEQRWLDQTMSYTADRGYNAQPTAGSSAGRTPSDVTRAKLRAAGTGRRATPEAKAKMSASQKARPPRSGHKPSAETRARMSAAHQGLSMEAARAASPANKPGRAKSAEHRARISEALKGRPVAPERIEILKRARAAQRRFGGPGPRGA